jgi:hypothetical protein
MAGNPLRKLEAPVLYAQIGRLIQSFPQLAQTAPGLKSTFAPLGPVELTWLGRAEAVVIEALGLVGQSQFDHIRQNFDNHRPWAVTEIQKILYRCLAQVEIELPSPSSGAFIPAGDAFDALKAVQRIFSLATHDVLIVDPYLDEKILSEFAIFLPEGKTLRLLADAGGVKPTLGPAYRAWLKQYSETRPLRVKIAPARALHDRLIIIDSSRVWAVGQSFRDLAVRAPTSFVESDSETAAMKIQAYIGIWDGAEGFS